MAPLLKIHIPILSQILQNKRDTKIKRLRFFYSEKFIEVWAFLCHKHDFVLKSKTVSTKKLRLTQVRGAESLFMV